MKVPLTLVALMMTAPASAEINIIPFATNKVEISQSYHGEILSHIRRILASASANGCPSTADVRYYIPSVIPADYSRNGTVSFNAQRTKLSQFTEQNDGNIVFVRYLSACGPYENDERVSGCASPKSVPVVEITGENAKEDALTILHEIGHSFGVSWDNPTSDKRGQHINAETKEVKEDMAHVSDINRLMYYSLTGNHQISNYECSKYRLSNALFKRQPQAAVLADQEVADNPEQSIVEPSGWQDKLKFILGMRWLHGPLRIEIEEIFEAAGGEERVLDEIRQIIVSNEHPYLWSNALTTLGIYGSESDLSILEYFLQKEVQIPDQKQTVVSDAKISAARASGRLLERYRSQSAAVLSAGLIQESQDVWAERVSPDDAAILNLSGLSADEAEYARIAIVQGALTSQAEILSALINEGSQEDPIFNIIVPYVAAVTGEGDGIDSNAEEDSYLLLQKLEPGFSEGLPEF